MPDEAVPHAVVLGSGSGTPIVMLHGWGQDSRSLLPLAQLLGDLSSIHLLDLPGFGASPGMDRVWGVSEYTQAVFDYINRQGWPKVVLIGHSLGGRISIKTASVHPSLVEKVVLIASAGIKRRRTLEERLRFFYIALLRWLIRWVDRLVSTDIFKSWFIPRYASADYLTAGPMRDSLVRVINEDLAEAASQIASPVLLLWGSEDRETPLEMGERFSRIIPRARLKVVPGEGHYPFLGAGAHLCAHAIRKFLAEPQADSGPSCLLEGVGRA